jgi:hypothetical protein
MTRRLPQLAVPLLLLGAMSACMGPDGPRAAATTPAANAGFGDRATPTPTAGDVRSVDRLRFLTPSTNIGCDLTTKTVRCDIGRKEWAPPPKPGDCSLGWGNGVYVDDGKVADFICAGDTLLGSGPVVLAYGHAVRAGDFLCDSESVAMHCTNEKTGHGFTLSAQDYHLF